MAIDVADSELKARHRAMWAKGNYPRMVDTFLLPIGQRLVDACPIAPGTTVLDVASGTGNAALRAAARGASVTASDLTPELLADGRRRAGGRGPQARVGRGGRGEAPVRGRVLRRRDVVDRRDVRASPPGGGRRARARLPPRRHGRAAVLDARGHARRAVPHDEAVRAAASPGRAAPAAVGQRGAPAGAHGRPRRVPHPRARDARDHGLRTPARLRRALQGLLRADDRRQGQRRQATGARRSSTRRSTSSATNGTAAPATVPASSRSTWWRSLRRCDPRA